MLIVTSQELVVDDPSTHRLRAIRLEATVLDMMENGV